MRWTVGVVVVLGFFTVSRVGESREVYLSDFTGNERVVTFDGEPIGDPSWDFEAGGILFDQSIPWERFTTNGFDEQVNGPPESGDPNGFDGASLGASLHAIDILLGQNIQIGISEFIKPLNRLGFLYAGHKLRVQVDGLKNGLGVSERYDFLVPGRRLIAFEQEWDTITQVHLIGLRDDGGTRWGLTLDDFRYEFFMQPGDTDGDFDVDIADLNNVRNHFGAGEILGPPVFGEAFPFNGVVDLGDLNLVRNFFGTSAETTAVPEPSTSTLATLMLLVVSVWRKRP